MSDSMTTMYADALALVETPEEENEGRDCPVCGGDCSATNPPVYHCPMRAPPSPNGAETGENR